MSTECSLYGKGNGEAVLVYAMKARGRGGVEILWHAILIWTLGEDE